MRSPTILAGLALSLCPVLAQDEPPATAEPAPAEVPLVQRPQTLAWPRDRERPVCKVGDRVYTLEDLLRHIDERHYPGMLELMKTVGGRGYLTHPLMAQWVRQFADSKTLEAEARLRGADLEAARSSLSAALKSAFESYLADYQMARAARGDTTELTQRRVDILLTDFQRERGLETEVRGWMDFLVPEVDASDDDLLRDYYSKYPHFFGGVVTISQILIEHRDPRTLELKTGEAREAAFNKLADVRSRLEDDGSNFEDVARVMSDDRRTAHDGGRLSGVQRFDPRLPAAVCRAAWLLRDGETSEPFESPFGIHIVKRVAYQHRYYVLFTDQIKPEIAATMRKHAQEDLVFTARKQQDRILYY